MVEVFHANCLDHMRGMGEGSVDAIVSDPPYGLSFMGKDWDHGVPGVHFWEEAIRVAKPGAHLLAFGGTRTFHRLAVAIEDAGWEIRDTLMWVYGSGFPKSHNLDGEHKGWGTALKPAWEPIIMARKPFKSTVGENVRVHGTGAINVDGCRIESGTEHMRGAVRGTANGVLSDMRPSKDFIATDSPLGRWPANLIHDGSDEVAGMFPNTTTNKGTARADHEGGNFWDIHHRAGDVLSEGSSGSAARFFYCAKASKSDRDDGLDGFTEKDRDGHFGQVHTGTSAAGNTTGNYQPRRNSHPTVKPTALMRYLCRLVTPPGGVVFDPFMGSGSTGKAAALEGFSFIGCDLQEEYVNIARARIEHAENKRKEEQGLFAA